MESYPIQLLTTVWRGTNEVTGHSWERLNSSMQDGLSLAIKSGMKFDKDDFHYIADHFRFYYWGGNDRHMLGERYYIQACAMPNVSAAISFESWVSRKPFVADVVKYGWQEEIERPRGRLAIGSTLFWNGEKVTVTSFSEDQTYLVACSYKPGDEYPTKIKHQYKITHKDLKNYRAALKSLSKAAGLSIADTCKTIGGHTIEETWERIKEHNKKPNTPPQAKPDGREE